MSAMSASATATRVAATARARHPAAGRASNTSARAVSTGSLGGASGANAAAASRAAQFFQGERAASFALRQPVDLAPRAQRSSAKRVVSMSATPAPVVKAAAAAEWKGAKLKPLGFSVLAGLLIWLCPPPVGVTAKAWHLLAIFVGTIVGIITNVRSRYRGLAICEAVTF